MAANNSQLQRILHRYINLSGEGKVRMREVLQTTSVEVRYNALMSVRGGRYQYTTVHRGAVLDDLDSLKCMMSGFTTDQLYNIVKERDTDNKTAVYIAAARGCIDTIMVLLSKCSQEQRFNILKIQRNDGCTALHAAAKFKHTSTLQAMLTSVSPGQQEGLLNIKDGEGKTIANIIPLPELAYPYAAWTKMELDATNEKLTEVEKQCIEQKATIDQLKVDLAKQREDNAKQVEQQTQELRNANQQTELLRTEMNKRMEAIEKLCEGFDKQGQELGNSNQKVEVLRVEMDKQKEANEKLSEKCVQKGQDLANARQKIEVLEADKAQLTEDLRNVSQRIEVVEADKAQLSEELRDTKQKMVRVEDKQREDNTKLSERCEQQDQELGDSKEEISMLKTSNIQQRNYMDRQVQDQGIIVDHKLEAFNIEQKATIDQLRAELDRQREGIAELAERAERYEMETIQQAQELRSLVDRQAEMENMMEEMDRLLGQPMLIGPEMDQEYEDH